MPPRYTISSVDGSIDITRHRSLRAVLKRVNHLVNNGNTGIYVADTRRNTATVVNDLVEFSTLYAWLEEAE